MGLAISMTLLIVLGIMLARDLSDVLLHFGRLSYAKTSAANLISYIGLAGSNNDVSLISDNLSSSNGCLTVSVSWS